MTHRGSPTVATAVLAVVLLAGFNGCSNSDTAPGGAAGSAVGGAAGSAQALTAFGYLEALRQATCDAWERCGVVVKGTCEGEIVLAGDPTLDAKVAAGEYSFDASAAAACVDKARTMDCCDIQFGTGWGADPCELVLQAKGPNKIGDPCSINSGCELGSYCNNASGQCPGVCRAWPKEGEPVGDKNNCGPGLYPYDGICTAIVGEGANCIGADAGVAYLTCQPGLSCFIDTPPNGPVTGHCKPLGCAGESCGYSANCAGGTECRLGKCTLLRKPGEPCTSDYHCMRGAFCSAEVDASTGTCKAGPTVGEPCTVGPMDHCVSGFCKGDSADAKTGVCVPSMKVGEACGDGAICEMGLECHEGICRVAPDRGAPCASDADCGFSSNLKCSGGVCLYPGDCYTP